MLFKEKKEESLKMYEYILDKYGVDEYEEENRTMHILKHMKDDKTKENHGIFNQNPLEIFKKVQEQMSDKNKSYGYLSDIYLIKFENCGYAGGRMGDGHTLNYVTIITYPDSKKLITMFPSDNIFELEKNMNSNNEEVEFV